MEKLKTQLQNYLGGHSEFLPYYPDMNILTSRLYQVQLKEILDRLEKDDIATAKSFALYLDTVIINIHTKVKKYKQSRYFDDKNIKDIENQGHTIVFYHDGEKGMFVLLGIMKS